MNPDGAMSESFVCVMSALIIVCLLCLFVAFYKMGMKRGRMQQALIAAKNEPYDPPIARATVGQSKHGRRASRSSTQPSCAFPFCESPECCGNPPKRS